MPKMVTKQMKTKLLCVFWIVTVSGTQISRPSKTQRESLLRLTMDPASSVRRYLRNHSTATESLQSDHRKLCMEGGENTQSVVLFLKRPQGSVHLFKSTSGKNSPVMNPACSTAKQVKAPQNAQS